VERRGEQERSRGENRGEEKGREERRREERREGRREKKTKKNRIIFRCMQYSNQSQSQLCTVRLAVLLR
jgi:hypothetical protein